MSNIMYFFAAIAALIVGYIVYGSIVDKVFGSDPNRVTPAKAKADGVDYVEMKPARIWLIQLLNIAGVGPIFGPILGALYGPAALVWIVVGAIFAGAVHDYLSGMLSMRYGGSNMPNIVGYTLGNSAKQLMRVFSVVLLLLVGVVFVSAPAKLLSIMTPEWMSFNTWLIIIFAYYFLATILPIDKIIGNLYPLFGAVLMVMSVGMITMLIADDYTFYPALEWTNQHPKGLPLWPLIFITIACGAISGFHSTQSPLMARCLPNEKLGKPVFYGSMIAEGAIALVWATVGMTFYQDPAALGEALGAGGPGKVVSDAAYTLMGSVGGVFAMLGVIVLPITSGDTAFRATRLTIAEVFSLPQSEAGKRLLIAVPLFALGAVLSQVDFNIIWRYFGFANQTLSSMALWAGAAYLYRNGRFHWIASLPATFMTAVCGAYILAEKNMGFGMSYDTSNMIGIALALVCLAAFIMRGNKAKVEEYVD